MSLDTRYQFYDIDDSFVQDDPSGYKRVQIVSVTTRRTHTLKVTVSRREVGESTYKVETWTDLHGWMEVYSILPGTDLAQAMPSPSRWKRPNGDSDIDLVNDATDKMIENLLNVAVRIVR